MFATPEPLPAPINLPGHESLAPWVSPNSLTMYFTSDRPGGYGKYDIWVAERSSTDAPWGAPTLLDPSVSSSSDECCPSLPSDGLSMYFTRYAPQNGYYVAQRNSVTEPWQEAIRLPDTIN